MSKISVKLNIKKSKRQSTYYNNKNNLKKITSTHTLEYLVVLNHFD